MTNGNGDTKALDQDAIRRSVAGADGSSSSGWVGTLTLSLAGVADDVVPWGRNPTLRDRQLRELWPTENMLAGAVYSTTIRDAAFSWTLDGPPRTASMVQEMLQSANLGMGWLDFAVKVGIDLRTQDNGAFIEKILAYDAENAPVIGINHLDAARCQRTGIREEPVIFTDRQGERHKLKWYQVICLTEMPSPIESMNGMQYCAVTRVLRAAQILRDIAIYKREKIGARGPTDIHLVSGVTQTRLEDAERLGHERADNMALMRWMQPVILASLDPNAGVTHETIPVKSLPDGFDEDVTLRWYIAQLALGFGADYQDFAPLPGGGLGTSNQSEILHRKSRGKGPAFFMKLIEHAFNFHGVMPTSVTFRYDEQDSVADLEAWEVKAARAGVFKTWIDTGILTPTVARQMLMDEGDLTEEELALLGQEDVTEDVTVTDDTDYQEPEEVVPVEVATTVPPAAGYGAPELQKSNLILEAVRSMRTAVGRLRRR